MDGEDQEGFAKVQLQWGIAYTLASQIAPEHHLTEQRYHVYDCAAQHYWWLECALALVRERVLRELAARDRDRDRERERADQEREVRDRERRLLVPPEPEEPAVARGCRFVSESQPERLGHQRAALRPRAGVLRHALPDGGAERGPDRHALRAAKRGTE